MLVSSSLYIVDERYWRDPYLFFCLLLCITSKRESHDTVSFSSFPTPLKRVKVKVRAGEPFLRYGDRLLFLKWGMCGDP